MNILLYYKALGVNFKIGATGNPRIVGGLPDEALMPDIRARRLEIAHEVKIAEFEALLNIVTPRFYMPIEQYDIARECAQADIDK